MTEIKSIEGYNIANERHISFVVITRSVIDELLKELTRIYTKISNLIKTKGQGHSLSEERYRKLISHQHFYLIVDFDYIDKRIYGDDIRRLYVGKTLIEIQEMINKFNQFKEDFVNHSLISRIIYESDSLYTSITYEFKTGLYNSYGKEIKTWNIYRIYERMNDLLDDEFQLLNNSVEITINKTNSIIKFDQITEENLGFYKNMIIIKEIQENQLYIMSSIFKTSLTFNKYYVKLSSEDYKITELTIDYLKMAQLYPVLTGQYLVRNFKLIPEAIETLINEYELFRYLFEAISKYLNSFSEDTEKLYYHLALMMDASPSPTREDRIQQLKYLFNANDYPGAKEFRNLKFMDLIGQPFGRRFSFDINFDVETLINLGSLINK